MSFILYIVDQQPLLPGFVVLQTQRKFLYVFQPLEVRPEVKCKALARSLPSGDVSEIERCFGAESSKDIVEMCFVFFCRFF